jgi:DNA-binding transcriptional ArsR family regulator
MVNYLDADLDRTFAALGDPTRRKLLSRLAGGEARVTELAQPFAMSLPAVSKHLLILERAGLLTRTKHGREHVMRLNAAPLRQAAGWVETYRTFWEGSLDALALHLEQKSKAKKTT